jgi:ATP-binding cassette subfamily B protein
MVQKALADMSTLVHEHYSGIRIVKSYGIEDKTSALFQFLGKHLFRLNLQLECIQGMFFPLLTFITKIVTIFLVILAGFIIIHAWNHLTTADFISFMWIQSFIFSPVLMLGWVLPIYQKGSAAYSRLRDIFNEPFEVEDNKNSSLKIPKKADIIFNHLTFHYPKTSLPALQDITLTIKAGSFVGITGSVGSGKTTLFRLLNRDYEIPHGKIFIGDHDIHDYSLDTLKNEFVTVEQIPFLFSKTIAENVLFGRNEASQEDLEIVTQQADLHETVMSFPERYDTMVGERGVTLSGGQKQRLALARAFLTNRSIMLFDDVFSSVDASTEKRIFDEMKNKLMGKTILLITHRVSLLEKMDRVITLVNGQIVEDGPPGRLMEQNGHFAALVELQKNE